MATAIIADDHGLVRDAIRSFIETHLDMTVVGEAGDGRSAVELASRWKPDIAIVDIGMPKLNGIDATRQIIEASPNTRVIAVTMHSDRRFVVQMLRAGATGYFVKNRGLEDMAEAIRTVLDGGIYLSAELGDEVIRNLIRQPHGDQGQGESPLTAREREVLQLIAEGRSTREIGHDLGISIKTVETHRARIVGKLGVSGVADLTRYAIREGIISIDVDA